MSNILTIDRGNTLVKLKVFKGYEQLYASVHEGVDCDMLSGIIERYDVACAAYCSTASEDAHLVHSLENMFKKQAGKTDGCKTGLLVLSALTPLPIDISAYKTPHTLGADRIAVMCGAAHLFPHDDMLIADAGTAITLDVLEKGTRFVGGNISAGVSLRLRALNEYTAALPHISVKGDLPEFGVDTETALRCGAIHGVADEIFAEYLRLFADRSRKFRLLLTGGDADMLADELPSMPLFADRPSTDIEIIPNLVSIGLISILEYNGYI